MSTAEETKRGELTVSMLLRRIMKKQVEFETFVVQSYQSEIAKISEHSDFGRLCFQLPYVDAVEVVTITYCESDWLRVQLLAYMGGKVDHMADCGCFAATYLALHAAAR